MKITVLSDYDKVEKVDARDLQRLIDENRIIAILRASGWVRVGHDPIRGCGGDYIGPERREVRQRPPQPENGCHFCVLSPHSAGESDESNEPEEKVP